MNVYKEYVYIYNISVTRNKSKNKEENLTFSIIPWVFLLTPRFAFLYD